MPSLNARGQTPAAVSTREQSASPGERAVDRDPRLPGRLVRQFDRGVTTLRPLLVDGFGEEGLDAAIAETREEYEAVIDRLPWIGGSANPRSTSPSAPTPSYRLHDPGHWPMMIPPSLRWSRPEKVESRSFANAKDGRTTILRSN